MSTIRNREQVSIPVDFKISNGKIGGTDIDFLLEFDGEFLILVECKKEGTQLSVGQRLVLERIVDAWRASGGRAVSMLVWWDTLDNGFINLRRTRVESYYTENGWQKGKQAPTIDFINIIGDHWGCRKCRF